MQTFEATISEINTFGPALKSFTLTLPQDLKFRAIPGQSVSVLIPEEGKPRPRVRPYTIASAPHESGVIKLIIDLVPGGLTSTWMHARQVGDSVSLQGSYGRFFLKQPLEKNLIFICAGSGIAPFRSMILDLFDRGTDSFVTLFYENEYENKIPWHQDFLELASQHAHFVYQPIIVDPQVTWSGLKGSIDQVIQSQDLVSENRHVYICGLKKMIQEVKEVLKLKNFNEEDIRVEKYD